MHRVRFHTAAGAFTTLLAMLPWKLLEAAGMSEDHAASFAGAILALTALAALWARRFALLQKSFELPAFRETFEVSAYLRAFAAYAFALLLLLGGGFWAFTFYSSR